MITGSITQSWVSAVFVQQAVSSTITQVGYSVPSGTTADSTTVTADSTIITVDSQ